MTVEIEIIFKDASTPKRYTVDGTYTKGDFFCLRIGDMILKYPMINIFSVCSPHGFHLGCKITPRIHPAVKRR
jgi:hypothetical protein